MVESVCFDGCVVEPGAVAGLPFQAAYHAEFGATATCHVVAAFLQFDRCGAVETALPSLLLRYLDEFLGSRVFGAFAAGMPFVVARAADFRLAFWAFTVFPSPIGTTASVNVDMRRFDPFPTAPRRAVYAVLGGVFLVFAVPLLLEAVIEESFDVFEIYTLGRAACRRHMLWVCSREGEYTTEAGMTHPVITRQFGAFRDGDVIAETRYAFNPMRRLR